MASTTLLSFSYRPNSTNPLSSYDDYSEHNEPLSLLPSTSPPATTARRLSASLTILATKHSPVHTADDHFSSLACSTSQLIIQATTPNDGLVHPPVSEESGAPMQLLRDAKNKPTLRVSPEEASGAPRAGREGTVERVTPQATESRQANKKRVRWVDEHQGGSLSTMHLVKSGNGTATSAQRPSGYHDKIASVRPVRRAQHRPSPMTPSRRMSFGRKESWKRSNVDNSPSLRRLPERMDQDSKSLCDFPTKRRCVSQKLGYPSAL